MNIQNPRRKKILLLTGHLSGSNTYFLYKNMPSYIADKYDVSLQAFTSLDKMDEESRNSDVFVTTHGNYFMFRDRVMIELWHGFPLKGMANMDPEEKATQDEIAMYWRHVDLIMSYSPLYNTLMNACMGTRIHQYRITGMPRNDGLFESGQKEKFESLFRRKADGMRIVYYMPTFRVSAGQPEEADGSRHWNNPFGFDAFDHEQFADFLERHNILLILKLHPFEEALVREQVQQHGSERILFLSNTMLTKSGVDLYELLGYSDALITDYSSVYFDYLLLDKPILFTPTDLEDYRRSRNFLLEPYEDWTPGPKVTDQESLQQKLASSLEDPSRYAAERNRIARAVHRYRDGNSSERVWQEIDRYLEERETAASPAKAKTECSSPEAGSFSGLDQSTRSELEQLDRKLKESVSRLIEGGQTAEALAAIREYESTNGLNAEWMTMKAVACYVEGKFAEAIESLNRALGLEPNHFDALYNLAHIHETMGNGELALQYCLKAEPLSPDAKTRETLQEQIRRLKELRQDDTRPS